MYNIINKEGVKIQEAGLSVHSEVYRLNVMIVREVD